MSPKNQTSASEKPRSTRGSRKKKVKTSPARAKIQIDSALLAKLRCDRLRVKIYLPNTDLVTVGAEQLFESTPVFISDFDHSLKSLPPPVVADKKKSGHWGTDGGRTTTTIRRSIEYKAMGVYIELDYSQSMLAIEFQGKFWTLAEHPWRLVYNITHYLRGLDVDGIAQVSRIDINRHFVGAPLELFPEPMSELFHYGFLPEGSKPIQQEGNLYLQKSESSRILIYDKTRQVMKSEEAVQEKFFAMLRKAHVPEVCTVSRFEVSIKGKGKALAQASYALNLKTLGSAAGLQRVFCAWARAHRVLEAPPAAKRLDKSRDYRRKKWKPCLAWKKLTTVSPSISNAQTELPDRKVAPNTRPAQDRDKLKSLVRRTAVEAIKRGVSRSELFDQISKALIDLCAVASQDLVERDMASRALRCLSPQERKAGDAPPEWMAQLLRPQAALAGSSISRQASPFELLDSLINWRKKSWKYPCCPETISGYRRELEKVLLKVQLAQVSAGHSEPPASDDS